ncbi:hypothetical protein Peur_008163 [Populus x canadensis]
METKLVLEVLSFPCDLLGLQLGPLFLVYSRREISVSIDELNPNFLPCSPLLSLATTPFLFCLKTTNAQDDARASFFLSVPSFQMKIENTNLHRSVPPLLQLQKNPRDSCWERSTSEIPNKAAAPWWFAEQRERLR